MEGDEGGRNVLELGEERRGRVPDLGAVEVVADDLFEVGRHGATVDLRAVALLADALVDLEDQTGETIAVDPDFLVVGHLAQIAVLGDRVSLMLARCVSSMRFLVPSFPADRKNPTEKSNGVAKRWLLGRTETGERRLLTLHRRIWTAGRRPMRLRTVVYFGMRS